MKKIYVFGHKNPDLDSINSAISLAYLRKKKFNENIEAISIGNFNDEVKYIFKYFNIDNIRIIKKFNKVENVFLVDHNEFQQSIENIEKMNIIGVIDHHQIDNFKVNHQIYFRSEVVGCTCTIIFKIFKEQKILIPYKIAGLMLSSIISDTLLLKSPTCTIDDKNIAYKLAKFLKINIKEFGINLLKAGINFKNKSIYEILNLDVKNFIFDKYIIRIAQVNVINFDDIFKKYNEFKKEMLNQVILNNYIFFILMVTDILNNNSRLLIINNKKINYKELYKIFDLDLIDNQIFLKNVVSRKKQILPKIYKFLKIY